MRERFARFMAGRNGNDQLNVCLLAIVAVLLLLGAIVKNAARVFYPLVLILLVLIYFRMFSRDLPRRSQENGRFMRWWMKVAGSLRVRKERWVQRRDYKFFVCPSCKTVLRVPRGKGKIKLVCRKCGSSFFGKS
ncbi:MAG: hypothetical protein J5927_06155 [Oscillospiraceae bacterium]|nr:hypothetical protein [Oscillospiraceae bacterium]